MGTDQLKQFLLTVLISFVAMSILAISNYFLSDRIRNNRINYELKEIQTVMPISAGNGITEDQIQYSNTKNISDKKTITVFRQWNNDVPSGLVLAPIITKGYMDKITLCIGIHKDGKLSGIRIIDHNETKNLGDQIDQANSDWLQQFKGLSLTNTKTEDWEFKQNGGKFDAISGASITAKSVMDVIHNTLNFYTIEGEKLYSSD